MADSILKLRVESSEYDAKLKKAAEGIRHLTEVAHQGGGELTGLEKSELDYVKGLGEMETKSRTAAGSVRELESTYKELKVIYDQLNEVEKADEGGKALAASLEQIKQRAQDARAQLDNASKSLNDNGQSAQQSSGFLEALASKFTINIDALKLFDMGLKAAGVALDVAKDAFFASEATVDEWGRTMQSAESLYEGFLTAINNGDISGYLSRMDEIVQAARAAYNELDTLGTMKTIQAPKMSAQQIENERLRMMIQTGRYIAPIYGRKASMKDGQLLTPEQIKTLERQLQNGMKSVVKLVGNEVKQTGKAINAYYNSIAKQNGMSLQEFKKGTNSWEEFSKKMQGYEQYKEWDKQARTEFAKQGGRGNVDFDKSNPFAEFRKWGTFRVDKMGDNSYNDLVRLIQQRDQQAAQAYGMQSQAYRTMNRAEGVTVRQIMGGGGSGGGGGKTTTTTGIKDEFTDMEELVGLIPVAEQKVKDLQQQIRESWDEGEIEKLREDLKLAQAELDRLNGKAQKIDLNKMFPERGASGGSGLTRGQEIEQSIRIKLSGENMEADKQTLRTLLETQIKYGIESVEIPTDALLNKIMGDGLDANIPDEYWANLQEQINEKLRDMGVDPIEIDFKTGKDKGNKDDKNDGKDPVKALKDFNSDLSQVTGGIGNIANGIQQLGIELPQGIQDAVSVLTGISSIITGITSILGLILVAQQTTAVASWTDAIIPFANGGIVPHAANGYYVPGNHYSNDVTPIMANAGELILNKAAQGNLASQLSGSGMQNMKLDAVITGEQIRLVLNNNGRRTGRGEYVQTNSRRV